MKHDPSLEAEIFASLTQYPNGVIAQMAEAMKAAETIMSRVSRFAETPLDEVYATLDTFHDETRATIKALSAVMKRAAR